jgi:predicted ATPase/class 3 adenylate cyclase
VPAPALTALLAQPTRDLTAGHYVSGTLLFVELVGMRALASRLAERGRQGNEQLTGLLNQVFASLVEQVSRYGGGVIKFGGDTCTVFFDAAHHGGAHAMLAATAALALRSWVDDHTLPTSVGPFRLQLRCGAHSGKFFLAEVGDSSHRATIVTGYGVNRVAVALERALAGEILLTEETLRALRGARAQPRPNDFFALGDLDTPADPAALAGTLAKNRPGEASLRTLLAQIAALRLYLPQDLPARFREPTPGDAVGEFRPVTVMFADFYAFQHLLTMLELPALVEHDTALVGRVLNSYYTRVHAVVRQHGGSINKIDMATFGNRLMALFGAPAAHSDDSARAVQAALALRDAATTIDGEIKALLQEWVELHPEHRILLRFGGAAHEQRVGIAAGSVFAGIIGTPQRHDYTVLGPTVQVAARLLESAGKRDILLTSRVQRVTRHLVETRALAPLVTDAFPAPLAAFRVLQARASGRLGARALPDATPLIARQHELAQLLALAGQALGDSPEAGCVAAIVGEAGVGKSRLADELLLRLHTDQREVEVVRAACHGYEQTTPYALVTQLLRQLLRLDPDAAPQAQAELVAQQIERLAPEWLRFAPLLGPLLMLPMPATELTRGLTAEQQRDRLYELVVAICLAAAAARPLAIAIDDLQWSDSSSLALLQRLALGLKGRRLLLLLIGRPGRIIDDGWVAQALRLTLHELEPAHSRELARALLGGSLPALLTPLLERLDGTPFFIEEMVRYLVDSGSLRRLQSGEWAITRPLAEVSLPTQIEQLITARLDALSEAARSVLQVAAVIGTRFSQQMLVDVMSTLNGPAAELDELLSAGLIARAGSPGEAGYRFKHALIRDVVYGGMLFARRRALHRHVAAATERLYAASLEPRRVVVAQHYYHAEAWAPAFEHLLAAAQQAQARYAHPEALALYRQALHALEQRDLERGTSDLRSAVLVLESSGDILALVGSYEVARASFEQALASPLGGAPDAEAVRCARLQRKIGRAYEHQGSYDAALKWLGQALGEVQDLVGADAAAERAEILSDTGWVYFRQGNLDAAQHALEAALADPEHTAALAALAQVHNRLGGVAWARGNLDAARRYVERSYAVSCQIHDLVGQAKMLNNLSILAESQGEVDAATRYLFLALELNERLGNRHDLALTLNNAGWTCYNHGDYEQAQTYFSQAIELAAELRDTYHQMRSLLGLGTVLAAQRAWSEAERAILDSQRLALQLQLAADQLEGYVVLGDLALQQNDLAAARRLAAVGYALDVDAESEEYARLQRLDARLSWAEGDLARAARLLEENLALCERLQNLPEAAHTRALLGELAAMQKRDDAAPPDQPGASAARA